VQTIPPGRRLSPKVRRLLREHDLDAPTIPGTGTAGRLTPEDVLAAAGTAGPTSAPPVLASPLARRVLRDAGIALTEAVAASGQRRLTRAAAERAVTELAARAAGADGPGGGADAGNAPAATRTDAVTRAVVDVSLLRARVEADRSAFESRNGFRLDLVVAIARTAAGVLAAGRDAVVAEAAAGAGPRVGILRHTPGGPTLAVVPHAEDLTVAGLARRARATAGPASDDVAGAATVIVAADGDEVPRDLALDGLGLLTCGAPAPRRVGGVDELGHEVVTTRPHVTLVLHHGRGTSQTAADAFLRQVAAAVAAGSTPVGQ
jgi:pyruvate dehydrogenase E2 component (dihydrolipoamide acetyltransferase)